MACSTFTFSSRTSQDVLDRLFAEIVVDAVDLRFTQTARHQLRVELTRRRQVVAERLFDDDPTPALVLAGESGGGKAIDHARKQIRRRRKVEQVVRRRLPRAANRGERRRHRLIERRIVELAGQVVQPFVDAPPLVRVERLALGGAHALAHLRPVGGGVDRRPGHAQDGKLVGQVT
jgi:hypothetical protein